MGLVPLQEEEEREISLSPPYEDTVRRWLSASQARELSPDTEFADTLILDFPTSRTLRNKCLVFKPLSLWLVKPLNLLPHQTNTIWSPLALARSELLSGHISPRDTFCPHHRSNIRFNVTLHWGETWWAGSGRKRVGSEDNFGHNTLEKSILKIPGKPLVRTEAREMVYLLLIKQVDFINEFASLVSHTIAAGKAFKLSN